MQSIYKSLKTNLFRQRPVSIVFSLTLQIVGILIISLISVNLCTIAQIHQQMTLASVESIWHIGMCSLMTTTIAVMPILIGAIVFVIWRSLRPLQKFTDA
ncbi:hypothetical protein ACE1CI_30385, partial [Aerosakkonemataceae cyanobacterium BLCC-F50]